MFKGLGTVYNFTLRQALKEKLYKIITILVAVVLFAGTIGLNVYLCNKSQKKTDITSIKNIYLTNESSMDINVKDISKSRILKGINIHDKQTDKLGKSDICIDIKEGKSININITASKNTNVSEDEADSVGNIFKEFITVYRQQTSGLTDEQSKFIFSNVSSSMKKTGEKAMTDSEQLAKIIFPLMFCIIVFVMIILYGSSISKIMIAEKTSKLMETLLVTTKPYAVIAGKILAMTTTAVIQFGSWIVCLIGGYVAGNMINESNYPQYKSEIGTVIEMLSNNSTAFSTIRIVIGISALLLGFFLYCVLAGMIFSFVRKAEELSSYMSIYQIPVFAGYFAGYIGPFYGSGFVKQLIRYIPFSAAYCVPADVVIGNISICQAVVSLSITVLTILMMIVIAGRIFKKRVF